MPTTAKARAIGGFGGLGKALVAKAGVRLEHDLLAAAPRRQLEGPGADRMIHRPAVRVAVSLDHLARDRGHRARAQVAEQDVIGLLQPDADRMPIDCREPLDRRVVIELAVLLRRVEHRIGADHLALQVPRKRRAHARVEQALPRVDVVGRRQLALLPAERGIVGEMDARPDADRPGTAAVLDRRQCGGRARHALVGPREIVEAVQGLEDGALHVVGIKIARRLRIESGFGDRERDAQRRGRRAAGVCARLRQRDARCQRRRAHRREHAPAGHLPCHGCSCPTTCGDAGATARQFAFIAAPRRPLAPTQPSSRPGRAPRRAPRRNDRCPGRQTDTGTSGCT